MLRTGEVFTWTSLYAVDSPTFVLSRSVVVGGVFDSICGRVLHRSIFCRLNPFRADDYVGEKGKSPTMRVPKGASTLLLVLVSTSRVFLHTTPIPTHDAFYIFALFSRSIQEFF